jgi:hypothetical protein
MNQLFSFYLSTTRMQYIINKVVQIRNNKLLKKYVKIKFNKNYQIYTKQDAVARKPLYYKNLKYYFKTF